MPNRLTAVICEQCGAKDAAFAQQALVRETGVVIIAECGKCGHRWEIDGSTPILRPKPDRRGS